MSECLRCGACCIAFGVVYVYPEDKVDPQFTETTELGVMMKQDGMACVCLTRLGCTIYDQNRPRECVDFKAGGHLCELARHRVEVIKRGLANC